MRVRVRLTRSARCDSNNASKKFIFFVTAGPLFFCKKYRRNDGENRCRPLGVVVFVRAHIRAGERRRLASSARVVVMEHVPRMLLPFLFVFIFVFETQMQPRQYNVTADLVLGSAQVMVSSGLRDAGYEYLLIDDGWPLCAVGGGVNSCKQIPARDAEGRIVVDPAKFPNGFLDLTTKIHQVVVWTLYPTGRFLFSFPQFFLKKFFFVTSPIDGPQDWYLHGGECHDLWWIHWVTGT